MKVWALFSVDLQQYNQEDEMVSILEWMQSLLM